MTSAEFTNVRNSSRPAARIAGILKAAWHAYRDWRARKATLEILRHLDGRTLRDIGVYPSEIESLINSKCGERKRWYDANWHRRPRA